MAPRDPVRRLHPDLLDTEDGRQLLRRGPEGWCPALEPDRRCRIYVSRPRCCAGFEKLGENCFDARSRLGLSTRWPPSD